MTQIAAVRLSTAVLTHPARLGHAEDIRRRHPELDLQVVVDPAPGAEKSALHAAYRLAWAAVAPAATHHLVIEDDTVLCPHFREHLLAAIAARPDEAIALFTEWGSETSYSLRLSALAGSAWAEVVDGYVPTQALVLPAEVAHGFSRSTDNPGPLYDFTLRAYLASVGVPAHVTVPNLAEDAGLSSVTGHDYLGDRAAACFVGTECPDIDWSIEPPELTAVPTISYAIGRPYSVVRSDGTEPPWRRAMRPVMPTGEMSLAAMLDLGQATVGRWPTLAGEVSSRLLISLWLTAYGIGQGAADIIHCGGRTRVAVDEVLARPFARRALATMPQGALRFLVDEAVLAEHRPQLTQLVECGVRQGYARGVGGPP